MRTLATTIPHRHSRGKLALFVEAAVLFSALTWVLGARAQSPLPDSFNPGANDSVFSLAPQADGKVLVGGAFTTLGGQSRNHIGRLHADGTLDPSFDPGANGQVYSLAEQADGKILVGGDFSTLGGQSRSRLGRVNSDGTLDTNFNPGADNSVYSLVVQADGKILVGGVFNVLGGHSSSFVGRLQADGTPDTTFNPGAGGSVESLAVQADGKILMGGDFTALGGQSRSRLGRINSDGTLDPSFNPGANNGVLSLAVQADGKILVGGDFSVLGGQSRSRIGRLNADETPDTSFNPGAGGSVKSLAVQADGKILVAGDFTTLGGQSRNHIGRLQADGTPDPTFDLGADSYVLALAVQADGEVLVGGGFTRLGGQSRNCIGRLNRTDPATQSLTLDGSTLTWMRGGTSPEVWRTTFEHSADGASWISLGGGVRIPGGWQLTGLALPINTTLRARGYAVGGGFNASSWFVETAIGSPVIGSQPTSLTNNAGTTAIFRVSAGGPGTLSYQWRRHGVNLADGGNVSGAATASLTLSNVLGRDAGGYSVVISNPAGSTASAVAVLTVIDPVIGVHPGSQSYSPGDSVTLSVTAAGTPPLTFQWRKDGVAQPGTTQSSLRLTNLQASDAGNYDVVVSNAWGSAISAAAVLSVNRAWPDSFNPGANNGVLSLALQGNGKILVGGDFTTLGGQSRGRIGRLQADGTIDSSFNPGANGTVSCLALQTDGKILVAGGFTTLGGQSRNSIGRLQADGTLDSSFNPGAIGRISSLALQADGRILVGGDFTTLRGQSRARIGRVNTDGTLDSSFNPGANGTVSCLALQADGKILVGGGFTALGGQSRARMGRLNADGTLDSSFNPGSIGGVFSLALQADGRILVGGSFTALGGQSRNRIGRLNADGTLDPNFDPGADNWVHSMALQSDGKILVGGWFTALGGQSRSRIGRLNADGTLDPNFDPGADNWVHSLALQPDGKILVGGTFTALGGQNRNRIGRLNNSEVAAESMTFDGSALTWMRVGTSPEVWRTILEYSLDGGGSWTSLIGGVRIPGGWQLAGLGLPTNSTFRARGFTVGGYQNGSSWFVEAVIGSPVMGSQPASLTNNAGTTATFSVSASGSGPLSYRWRKNGGNLADVGNVSGAATARLILSEVLGGDAGDYSVVITNAFGSVTSTVASLIVIDPVINVQPASQIGNAGNSVTLSVAASGTPPLSFQWRKDGVAQPGMTQSSLRLTNLQTSDAGSYDVVVSSAWGSATSTAAVLSVNLAPPDPFNPGADSFAFSLALQADGKILVGGDFTTLGGQSRNHLGRLHADGTLDATFNPGADLPVVALALQADGKILAGGWFTRLAGQSRNALGRLNANGTLDPSFNPGANDQVNSLVLLADGGILVGGQFTMLGGQSRSFIGRLNAEGTLDPSFSPEVDSYIFSLAVQADGKVVVGGQFTTLQGQSRQSLGRLHADGTLDLSFNPGADSSVYSLALQADGKILVGGAFTALGGQSRSRIGRLHADGTLDSSFNPGADSYYVASLALQADGRILVGGGFSTLGGQIRHNIGRLHADGTLDPSFNPGANNSVSSLALQADGKVLVGGVFTTLGGQSRSYIGRLNNTGPATQSLAFDGLALTWMRGGTSPEVWRTTFESSLDGTSWNNLGAGVRILGGWQQSGLSLARNTTFRAHGFTTDGDSSSWFVETVLRPALTISDILYPANGLFEFSAWGSAGQIVVIDASPDLSTWTPLQTNTLGAGVLRFSDLESASSSSRFYRARTP